ncbi:Peptidase C78 ubiquitin fold modifier-specific peptidase 1/ 2, partial [Trinorchestia longiramus]
MGGGQDYVCSLLTNPHTGLPLPPDVGSTHLVRGDYLYYHYGCDGFDDRGWGCGYRTLMSLSSWIRGQKLRSSQSSGFSSLAPVPSNRNIQEILAKIQDKPATFAGSNEWIGCVEESFVILYLCSAFVKVGLVLDEVYGVSCRIIHVLSGDQLSKHIPQLVEHFDTLGSPVMMGGDQDNLSKGIMGVCQGKNTTHLLVVCWLGAAVLAGCCSADWVLQCWLGAAVLAGCCSAGWVLQCWLGAA